MVARDVKILHHFVPYLVLLGFVLSFSAILGTWHEKHLRSALGCIQVICIYYSACIYSTFRLLAYIRNHTYMKSFENNMNLLSIIIDEYYGSVDHCGEVIPMTTECPRQCARSSMLKTSRLVSARDWWHQNGWDCGTCSLIVHIWYDHILVLRVFFANVPQIFQWSYGPMVLVSHCDTMWHTHTCTHCMPVCRYGMVWYGMDGWMDVDLFFFNIFIFV